MPDFKPPPSLFPIRILHQTTEQIFMEGLRNLEIL